MAEGIVERSAKGGRREHAEAQPRLSVEGVEKAFGTTRALGGVSFAVRPGAIHAVLGENGAGKSTLMKIVAGALSADAGKLLLDGAPYAPAAPLAARREGVAIVYQDPSVCPDLSVGENVVLGLEPRRFGWISRSEVAERTRRAFEPLGVRSIASETRAGDLSAAEQQLVEIARALAQENCRLLILDEPTSSLGGDDADRLFAALRTLSARGLSILYISHFLEEVRRIADDYTVLRDGRSIASGRVADTTNVELVEAMAGRRIETAVRHARSAGEVVLSLEALRGVPLPKNASLELRRGEVLGIAGLVGSGRTELLRAVFGLAKVASGAIRVAAFSGPGASSAAAALRADRSTPRRRLAQGVGLVSEDRAGEGLSLSLSIAENLTLSRLGPVRRRGLLSPGLERSIAQGWVEKLGIRARDVAQPVRELSGGNQQKVALARLLYHDVDVLLLDEPTRGIDVKSRAEIHAIIAELAARGKAVLLVSSQLPELLEVADRIAVMHKGVLGAARPAAERSERDLLVEATGA